MTTQTRTLRSIALECIGDWSTQKGGIYFGARPYLKALVLLDTIDEDYGYDSAKDIVLYFLSNAATWKGETARRVKLELKSIAGVK